MKHRIFLLFSALSCFFLSPKAQLQHHLKEERKFIEIDGKKFWIEIVGEGDPLFLIAGGPGSSHVYLHSFDPLQDSSKLVFVDYYGRGQSSTSTDPKGYTIEGDVEDLDKIRRALGFDTINILGHSFGSVIAQLYAIKYEKNVKHLIIVSGFYSGKMYQQGLNNFNRALAKSNTKLWNRLMTLREKGLVSSHPRCLELLGQFDYSVVNYHNPKNAEKEPKDHNYKNNWNDTLYYQFLGPNGDFTIGNEIASYDVTAQIKDLNTAVLILNGKYDRFCTRDLSIKYKQYCPKALFVMLDQSGHYPQVEQPEKVFWHIKKFLRK